MSEPILIGRQTENMTPRPTGPQPAVLVDISDSFEVLGQDGNTRQQCIFTWALLPTYSDKEGKTRHYLHSEWVTCSLHEKSILRSKILAAAASKVVTDEMLDTLTKNTDGKYDPRRLLNTGFVLTLIPGKKGYQKMGAITAKVSECSKIDVTTYVRPRWIDTFVSTQRAAANIRMQSQEPESASIETLRQVSNIGVGDLK